MLEQPSEGFAAQIKTHALLFGRSGQLWSSDNLANTRLLANVGLMLDQRPRWWHNNKRYQHWLKVLCVLGSL